jgi:hypothetical protein
MDLQRRYLSSLEGFREENYYKVLLSYIQQGSQGNRIQLGITELDIKKGRITDWREISGNRKEWKKANEDLKVRLGLQGQLRRRKIRIEVT